MILTYYDRGERKAEGRRVAGTGLSLTREQLLDYV
jgi:hypothetical protein